MRPRAQAFPYQPCVSMPALRLSAAAGYAVSKSTARHTRRSPAAHKCGTACKLPTHSPAIEEFRHTPLTWEAEKVLPTSYAVDPDKELHRLLRQYNVQTEGKRRQGERLDLSHPHIRVDMSQCIECLRCVHICEDVQGQFVWHVLDRGGDMHIVPDSGTTLGASSCVGCEMEVGYAEGRISGASGDRLTSA